MSEKKIAKPARRKKTADVPEKAAVESKVKKTKTDKETTSAKTVKNPSVKKKKTEDFVLDAQTGELKPDKKRASQKKLTVSAENAEVSIIDISSPELIVAAGSELAENVRVIEETLEDLPLPKVKTPRKKAVVAKTKREKPETSSSETPLKAKTAAKKTISKKSKSKKEISKSEAIENVSADAENKSPVIAPVAVSDIELETVADAFEIEAKSEVFKQLAEPKLPALERENRARLQIQSPHKIFFYWSVKNNPYETLHRVFPANRAGDYRLIIKLINLNDKSEQSNLAEAAGSWWFSAKPNTVYRAEIGFAAERRPFVRLMYSNTVETPRAEPSPNRDWSMDFAVTATQFAEVLDVAGYAHDAFEVAITGDDPQAANQATQKTFARLGGQNAEENLSELRFALFALASGAMLETLRDQIDETIYRRLDAIIRHDAGQLSAENVRRALTENFEFENEGEEFTAPVFGASSINFPRRKPRLPKLSPVSSFR